MAFSTNIKRALETKILIGILGGIFTVMLVAFLSLWTIRQLEQQAEWRRRSHQVLLNLEHMERAFSDAESATFGLRLTNDAGYLNLYHNAASDVKGALKNLRILGQHSAQPLDLTNLQLAVEDRLEHLQSDLASTGLPTTTTSASLPANSQQGMSRVRAEIEKLKNAEQKTLEALTVAVDYYTRNAYVVIGGGFLLAMVNGIILSGLIFRDLRHRRHAQQNLEATQHELALQLRQTEATNSEIRLLREFGSQMQSCEATGEAYAAIGSYAPRMLHGTRGATYVYNASRDSLARVAAWGDWEDLELEFQPNDCWSLRRGQPYTASSDEPALRCRHNQRSGSNSLCFPFGAQGEELGMIYIESENKVFVKNNIVQHFGDQIATSLSNLRLREALRSQSIRDALTGLYNRRYLEESFERELRRAARRTRPLAIIMFDLDHFKRLNDTFGHEAGDLVLSAVGAAIRSTTRTDDIACRYGGEELLLILPESELDGAVARAEALLNTIREIRISHKGHVLQVTASFGVAAFPAHGRTVEDLMRSADDALYEAKHSGRNQVVVGRLPAFASGPHIVQSEPAG